MRSSILHTRQKARLHADSRTCFVRVSQLKWSPAFINLQGRTSIRSQNATEPTTGEQKLKKTLADLDSLLGIEDDKAKKEEAKTPDTDQKVEISVNPAIWKAVADAESSRLANQSGSSKDVIDDQVAKIVEKARKLAEENSSPNSSSNNSNNTSSPEIKDLQQEFKSLLELIANKAFVIDKEDLKRLKDAAFGPTTFWVTETVPIAEVDKIGVLIRGNLREEREKVFASVCAKVKELFAGKYEVLMIEDTAEEEEEVASSNTVKGPRVAFQIILASQALPPQTDLGRQVLAVLLSFLFVASSIQLALVANISKLPKETLEFFASQDTVGSSDSLPPGLENWDPTDYFTSTIPLFVAILGINLMHETGHRIAAAIKGVRLGPSIFIPNFDLGSFGAITPFTSLLRDKNQLWDVAAAGPLAGALTSSSLLFLGLLQSHSGMLPPELLVPVPSSLFQGSLLLGGIARMALGEEALRQPEVLVSPFTVAGWCGALSTALNLLPVGQLDGGRMVQAAFGTKTLSLSSFFTYLGLGLGLLGSSLSLPFGLYVVICQRTAEKYIQDAVTPAGGARSAATGVAILTAILVLLPMAPELADAFGVGPANRF